MAMLAMWLHLGDIDTKLIIGKKYFSASSFMLVKHSVRGHHVAYATRVSDAVTVVNEYFST
jgi:hypothetical protein